MPPTQEQKLIIDDFDNNILLLARAGTGKTFTIANKIAKAISSGVCKSSEVLCVTFTVKAADELKEDVDKYCGGMGGAEINTIHGFCYSVIKEYGKRTGQFHEPTVADEVDVGELLTSILIGFAEDGKYTMPDGVPMLPERQLGKICSAVKHRRNQLGFSYGQSGGYKDTLTDLFKQKAFNDLFSVKKSGVKVTDYSFVSLLKSEGENFFEKYERIMQSSNLLDFDDLIFAAQRYINQSELFKSRYKLIIIDEMQDTSMLEYDVLRYFFKGANVLLCGDDAQTIYGWRGSAPVEVMNDFIKNYGAKKITLSKNRRSSPLLSYVGNYYVSQFLNGKSEDAERESDECKNGERKDDNFNQSRLVGEKIQVVTCGDLQNEAEVVFKGLCEYEGDYSEICVMARSNRYIADICSKFEKLADEYGEGAPKFFTADKDYQFYKKPIIKDFLAFLRLLVNGDDGAALERVAEKYVSGIGRATIRAIRDYSKIGLGVSHFLRADTFEYGDPYHGLLDAYQKGQIVVYDFETTGLDLSYDQPIQISALKFGINGKVAEMNTFIIPTVKMSEGAEGTHGYSVEHIKQNGGVDLKSGLLQFAEFSKGCVLVGHNSSAFDDQILKRVCQEEKVEICVRSFYDTRLICYLFHPEFQNFKLSTLCKNFGVVNEREHDAFADVLATSKCLVVLVEQNILKCGEVRRKIISTLAPKFERFYDDYRLMQGYLEYNDFKNLLKYINDRFSVFTKNPKGSDLESARDLFRILKDGFVYPTVGLREFLANAALSGSQMDLMIKKLKKIPVITVHQSKGCEFSTVILVGADENEFPSYGARQGGNEEEEKRVFYVALSRAKQKFAITYSSERVWGGNVYHRLPSPYIGGLPKEAVEAKKGELKI